MDAARAMAGREKRMMGTGVCWLDAGEYEGCDVKLGRNDVV